MDGFNLWTVSQAAVNAGGNVGGNAITLATAANTNNLIASAADPGGAGPGASVIPATPVGAPGPAPFNNIPVLCRRSVRVATPSCICLSI